MLCSPLHKVNKFIWLGLLKLSDVHRVNTTWLMTSNKGGATLVHETIHSPGISDCTVRALSHWRACQLHVAHGQAGQLACYCLKSHRRYRTPLHCQKHPWPGTTKRWLPHLSIIFSTTAWMQVSVCMRSTLYQPIGSSVGLILSTCSRLVKRANWTIGTYHTQPFKGH